MQKQWGIWGWGIVGKSAVAFLQNRSHTKLALCTKTFSEEDRITLQNQEVTLFSTDQTIDFLHQCDAIIVSPGIDTRPYATFKHKFVTEFDLFVQEWHQKIIAITGTVGKTTITSLLSHLLRIQHHEAVVTGGNIGIGMLGLLQSRTTADTAVLELSSFQLEHVQHAAPDLAIITNIYPNHLDRHGTLEEYTAAKLQLLRNQKNQQIALIPWNLRAHIKYTFAHRKAHTAYFSVTRPTQEELATLTPQESFYFYAKNGSVVHSIKQTETILTQQSMPTNTYAENWLIIAAALHILGEPLTLIGKYGTALTPPEHRLVTLGTCNGITFYNDSKATVPESTLAAVNKLQQPLILFLGGVSKGINRETLIAQLPAHVKEVICFGKEAEQLSAWCRQHNKKSSTHLTLEHAFDYALTCAQPGDSLLFSPAGASFDLFTNFEERGITFTQLVKNKFKNNLI